MIDTSRSEDSIQRIREFILSSLAPFRLAKEGTRVAILSYGSTAMFDLTFKNGITKKAIENALKDLSSKKDIRRVDVALYQSVVDFRNGLPRNIIVFVDGNVTRNLRYLRLLVLYIIRRGIQVNFIATSPVNAAFVHAVTTASSRVYTLPRDANLNQYLNLVIPSVTRTGMICHFSQCLMFMLRYMLRVL